MSAGVDLQVEVGDPLVRGALALYPLFAGTSPAPDYVPGPLAAATGRVQVRERDSGGGPAVAELVVTNAADLPVLMVEGEALLGAWQDRTLNVSVLLAAGATGAVPVSCVERGRWGGAPAGARLAPALVPTGLRARKQAAVAAGVMAGAAGDAGRHADQGDVWAAVDEYAARFSVVAPTAALDDVHQARAGDVAAMVDGTRPLPEQRGVAVAIGGALRAVDLFDRPSTLEAYWKPLTRGCALEAVGVAPVRPPGRRAVVAAFDSLRRSRTRRVPGVSLGEEVHAQGDGLSASALVWAGAVVHLALFVGATPGGAGSDGERRRWFA